MAGVLTSRGRLLDKEGADAAKKADRQMKNNCADLPKGKPRSTQQSTQPINTQSTGKTARETTKGTAKRTAKGTTKKTAQGTAKEATKGTTKSNRGRSATPKPAKAKSVTTKSQAPQTNEEDSGGR